MGNQGQGQGGLMDRWICNINGTAVVKLKGEKSELEEFLRTIHDGRDVNLLPRNFCLVNEFAIRRSDPRFHPWIADFWRTCGPRMISLELKQYHVYDSRAFSNFWNEDTPKLEKLVLGWNSNAMRETGTTEALQKPLNTKPSLKQVTIDISDLPEPEINLDFPFLWKKFFCAIPNLQKLEIRLKDAETFIELLAILGPVQTLRCEGLLQQLKHLAVSFKSGENDNRFKERLCKAITYQDTTRNPLSTVSLEIDRVLLANIGVRRLMGLAAPLTPAPAEPVIWRNFDFQNGVNNSQNSRFRFNAHSLLAVNMNVEPPQLGNGGNRKLLDTLIIFGKWSSSTSSSSLLEEVRSKDDKVEDKETTTEMDEEEEEESQGEEEEDDGSDANDEEESEDGGGDEEKCEGVEDGEASSYSDSDEDFNSPSESEDSSESDDDEMEGMEVEMSDGEAKEMRDLRTKINNDESIDIVANVEVSDNENETMLKKFIRGLGPSLAFGKVTTFHLDRYMCSMEELQWIMAELPKVVRLELILTKLTFPAVCNTWKKLKSLTVLYPKDILEDHYLLDDEIITGVTRGGFHYHSRSNKEVWRYFTQTRWADLERGAGAGRKPNITLLQELECFKLEHVRVEDDKNGNQTGPKLKPLLTVEALFDGFYRLPNLLYVEIPAKIDNYTKRSLESEARKRCQFVIHES